jgi:hypothetical protein
MEMEASTDKWQRERARHREACQVAEMAVQHLQQLHKQAIQEVDVRQKEVQKRQQIVESSHAADLSTLRNMHGLELTTARRQREAEVELQVATRVQRSNSCNTELQAELQAEMQGARAEVERLSAALLAAEAGRVELLVAERGELGSLADTNVDLQSRLAVVQVVADAAVGARCKAEAKLATLQIEFKQHLEVRGSRADGEAVVMASSERERQDLVAAEQDGLATAAAQQLREALADASTSLDAAKDRLVHSRTCCIDMLRRWRRERDTRVAFRGWAQMQGLRAVMREHRTSCIDMLRRWRRERDTRVAFRGWAQMQALRAVMREQQRQSVLLALVSSLQAGEGIGEGVEPSWYE